MTESQLVFPGDKGQEGKGYQRQEGAFGGSGCLLTGMMVSWVYTNAQT